ncbi:MAG: hypothetical protein KatS3mg105_0578 [Gemmatales bacterium]|nr:MAG: hypothetical protein KatS3mg105_0578 [Gemmatales bacterium]
MPKLLWKPWHEVVALRDDLKTGELSLQMFAADLYEVMMQRGKQPVYEKPESFFSLTFPTHNLRNLVRDVALRLAGKNDKAVRQLELTYGGGKTHTLITLYHLHCDPDHLPDLPAVHEFIEAIGQQPVKARVAALCFDKLDVEKGTEVRSPTGKTRRLKHPWSVLAYQIAGDDGLRVLHADGKAEERLTAPAENTLTELLEMPLKEGFGVLVLMDEVLMYAKEKVIQDRDWRDRLVNFFQYLTQAATKVPRCCIVASLLATDPKKTGDELGRQLLGDFYDIFRREKEEGVEPVVKEDVAEVLRRRFFKPESIRDPGAFRPHVIAALKGIQTVDEQTAKAGASAEERFLKSYPFHPDLTEVLYAKWTQMSGFQRTRGVLRTFALALREAGKWDDSPLIGPAVLLNAPGQEDVSEAMRELVTVADTEEHEGRKTAWTPILVSELNQAREIQKESVGLRFREIEQAVVATFLHSQPVGQTAHTRDLTVLVGATRPDKIELEKGLLRWSQVSHWLDDHYAPEGDQVPGTWRLGNRPNLNQMHAVAMKKISDEVVRARLIDEIGRVKKLTAGASAAGVLVHTLPVKPNDVKDDGAFRYAVLGPGAASDSGKPSAEAKRFLDENTGPDNPRVYRNAVLLLCPSRDGLEIAEARIRDYLAWEAVASDLQEQENKEKHEKEKGGTIDPVRMEALRMNIERSKGRIPEAIRQAYCIVVTVSEKNEVQAFKITVTDDPHFTTIKADKRARIQDTAITAEALLPGGPYDLWKEGETSRRVKDLAGAFAQLPHLPKMLKADAIVDTLVDGCEQGSFVLRLTRPDGTFRTWWRSRPDETALKDPALELVLPEAAELSEIAPELLTAHKLPELWDGDETTVQAIIDYFSGGRIVQVDRGGYQEPIQIPKASRQVVEKAIAAAVEKGSIWLRSGPASILGEPIPAGVLTPSAVLSAPPDPISAAEILPENLPDAWQDDETTALAVATALSQKVGKVLPWKTVRDAITGSLQARFIELVDGSTNWPCEFHAADSVRLKVAASGSGVPGAGFGTETSGPKKLVGVAAFEPAEIQDLGDIVPQLLDLKAKTQVPIQFQVRIEVGDGTALPPASVTEQLNTILAAVKEGFRVQ